jgi:hypothetical protein
MTLIAKPSLTEDDARKVKGMLHRGDRQHDIAAWFGVNGGRIAEVATGDKFWWVPPAPTCDLPPQGPYPGASAFAAAMNALQQARAALRQAEAALSASEAL